MANDFNTCGFGAITFDLIIKALTGCSPNLQGTYTQHVLRVEEHSEVITSPIHCANHEDFQITLQRALVVADDGQLALRVNYRISGVTTCGCNEAKTEEEILTDFFGEDAQGLVYFNIYITNAQIT